MSYSYEYTNSYTNLLDDYSNLEHYNNASMKNGPPLPPTVPSNMFPTILKQDPIASYDALTYETNQQYPQVNKAYGMDCQQKYFIGKCPSNKEIRPFPGLGPGPVTPTPKPINRSCPTENLPIVEGFNDTQDVTRKLKSLNILFFCDMSGNCPHSKRFMVEMSKQLSEPVDKVFIMKDISASEQNKQMFTNYGGYATPYFFSLKTNKSVTGYVQNASQLESMLKGILKEGYANENNDMKGKVKELDIVMFSSPHCGFCKMMKEVLKKHNLEDVIEIVEDLDNSNYKHMKGQVRGFPTMMSKKTGKTSVGYSDNVAILIEKLQ
jgi:glutaredoxin